MEQSKLKPFKPSSPAKLAGGCKAGTFDIYPRHSDDPYTYQRSKQGRLQSKEEVFRPSAGPKTMPTFSIVQQSIRKMNASNIQKMTTT
jgi:hypothetical protein